MTTKSPPLALSQLGVCLVTGAAGFLGRNIVRRLLDEGLTVRALIRKTPLNIEDEKLRCIHGDVSNLDDLLKSCDGVDTVFHTAALVSLLGGAPPPQGFLGHLIAREFSQEECRDGEARSGFGGGGGSP